MRFHLVPEDIFQVPVMTRRPRYVWRHPNSEEGGFGGLRTFPDALLPMLMSFKGRNGESACCQRRQTTECGQKRCTKKEEFCTKTDVSSKTADDAEKKIATFDFRGFAPEHIKVKVTDKAVIIRGEHKNTFNSLQITRTVPLPPGADKTGVVCRYVDGFVIIQLPDTREKSNVERTVENGNETAKVPPLEKDENGERQHCVTCPKSEDDVDKENQKQFENSLKQLTGLFSTIFGIDFDDEEVEEKKGTEERAETSECTTITPEKTKDTTNQSEACVNDSTDSTQCEDRDVEETCVMRKYDEKMPEKEAETDFVKVEKQGADASLSEQTTIIELEDGEVEPAEDRADDTVTSHPVDGDSKENTEIQRKEEFNVQLDLSLYKPENIRAVFKDGNVIVEAEREVVGANHTEVETVSRRIRVPEKIDETKLKIVLDSDGMMTISAPFCSNEDQTWQIIKVVHED